MVSTPRHSRRLAAWCVAALVVAMAAPSRSETVLKASHPFPYEAGDPRDGLMRDIGREAAAAGLSITMVDGDKPRLPHELWKAMARGDLDLTMAPLDRLVKRFPRLGAVTLPAVVSGAARAERIGESRFLRAIAEELDRAGLVLIARTWIGSAFMSAKGCVRGPTSVTGLRARTAGAGFEQTLQAAGARIAATPIAGLHPALQTGELDIALFSLPTLASLRLDEAGRCLTLGGEATPWLRFVPAVMAKAAYQRLDEAQRAALLAAGRRAEARFHALMRRREAELVERFRKAGIAIAVLTPADSDAWADVAKASAHRAFLAGTADGDALMRLLHAAD